MEPSGPLPYTPPAFVPPNQVNKRDCTRYKKLYTRDTKLVFPTRSIREIVLNTSSTLYIRDTKPIFPTRSIREIVLNSILKLYIRDTEPVIGSSSQVNKRD